ncbi:MAG: hypothetical protein ACOYOA_10205 [Saprospiraceae bacterium]
MFSQKFPAVHYWLQHYGSVELGEDEDTHSLIRILDDDGILYEDRASATFDESFEEAEAFLKDYFFENFEIKI